MIISILGGLGLFLLGMSVMTDGLRAAAGAALRAVLTRAASTPARGTLWGAVVTLLVQSSSATTMTTIGLVSAGLLTFPQALGVVFGANIGTTGTGWLVALLGVKFSLTIAAMPMVFCGAMFKLFGRGRWAGAGGAIAGFGLLLVGLTVLQEGMAGLALRLNPADLPTVAGVVGEAGEAGGLWRGLLGLLTLVFAGLVMTTVMQSSSAAVAATLSALHAGAIGPDQAAALVIGQNIGSAVSSAIAAIGATTPARRTAVAHVLFNLLTAFVALAAFPLYAPAIARAAAPPAPIDATILLAAFHTVYNVLGVAMLLPLIGPFSRLVERVVPQRGPVLTRFLDRSVLAMPAIALDAARRTIALVLCTLCKSTAEAMERGAPLARNDSLVRAASDALAEVRMFLSAVALPAGSEESRRRLANTLHALDHTTRLTENLQQAVEGHAVAAAPDDAQAARAAHLCSSALRAAAVVAADAAEPSTAPHPPEAPPPAPSAPTPTAPAAPAIVGVAHLAALSAALADLRREHRRTTLSVAATAGGGAVAADRAILRVDAVRRLDRLAYHAWRAAAHLAGSEPAADHPAKE